MTATAARGRFWLTVVSFNLGRKYPPGRFRDNVLRILDHTDGRDHVALLPQELDEEPDPANEHAQLARELVPGTRRVHWRTREPILLSPGFDVVVRRRVKIMGSGLEIGGPPGTGPARHLSMAVAQDRRTGIRLGFGNFHPHRHNLTPRVDKARAEGDDIVADALSRLRRFGVGVPGVYGTDYNHPRMPRMVPTERTAISRGLDHVRYWQAPASDPYNVTVTLKATGHLDGTIDPHDPLWARFLVEAGDR